MNDSHESKETNMYGTVARCRIKPGMERQLAEQVHMFEAAMLSGIDRWN
jgi:hypothetical protein